MTLFDGLKWISWNAWNGNMGITWTSLKIEQKKSPHT